MDNKTYYTLREVSEILDLSYQVIKNYVYTDNRIKSEKILNSRVVHKDELKRQMEIRGLIK